METEILSWGQIIGRVLHQFLPVWIGLVITFALSITYKRKLGLYGKLFDSPVGMIGFALVMFWVYTAIFADMIITMDPVSYTHLDVYKRQEHVLCLYLDRLVE